MKAKGLIALFIFLGLPVFLSLPGCGSLSTVPKSPNEIQRNLVIMKTKCNSIPWVYSGVAFDFCALHAEPRYIYNDVMMGFYMVDAICSGIADTVFLPYTGYLQYQQGNVQLQQ